MFRGFSDYLQINVDAALFNPSNITIGTGDVAFGLQFLGQMIGTANIDDLVLVPNENNVPTAVRYQPSGGAPQRAGQVSRFRRDFLRAPSTLTYVLLAHRLCLRTMSPAFLVIPSLWEPATRLQSPR